MDLLKQKFSKKHKIAAAAIFVFGVAFVFIGIWSRISPKPAVALTNSTWTDAGGDGNWNTATNWSTNSVPTNSTIVLFSASSTANCTINAAANADEIIIGSGYTGTITQGSHESITVGPDGFSQSGGTFTGNVGTSTSNKIVIGGAYSLTGGTFTSTGAILTIEGSSTFSSTFNNNSGTVLFSTSTLTITGSSTFNNFEVGIGVIGDNTALTIATGTTVTVLGNFFQNLSYADIQFLGGGQIDAQGNIEQGYNPNFASGTAQIFLDGTGNQLIGDCTTLGYCINGVSIVLPNLTIAKTSGTVTLQGTMSIINNFTNTNGTTINPGTSTVSFGVGWLSTSFSSLYYPTGTITGSSTFYNLTIGSAGNDVGSAQYTVATGTTLTVEGEFDQDVDYTATELFGGGEIDVQGNVESGYYPAYATGTVSIVLDGTGTQLIGDCTALGYCITNGVSLMLPNLTINKTSGSVTLQNIMNIAGNFTNTNATTINPGTSTMAFGIYASVSLPSAYTATGTITGSSTFYNLVFGDNTGNLVADQYTIPTGTVITAEGYFYVNENYSYYNLFGGGAIDVQGNIEAGYNAGVSTGTVSMVLDGTSTQIIGDDTLSGHGSQDTAMLPDLTIAKPSGIAYAELNARVAGATTISQGEFQLTTSTTATKVEFDGPVTVNTGTILSDYPLVSSTIKFGSTVTNNGLVFFDGDGQSCTASVPNYVILNSTTTNKQIAWSGSGNFIMRYVNVRDQGGTAPINVWGGTKTGTDVGSNFTFLSNEPVPELVQTSTASGGSGTTQLTLPAFGFQPRAGDLIIVAVSAMNQTIAAPTDNASNTYTLVSSSTFGSSPSYALSLYYAKNITTTSSLVVTVNGNGGSGEELSANAFEYTGLTPSSTFDQYSANTDNSGSATSLTSFAATGQDRNELYFGATTFAAMTTASSGSGWTPEVTILNSATTQGLYDEDVASSSPLSIAATWTAATSTSYADIMGLFHSPYLTGYVVSGVLDSATFDTGVASGTELNSVTWTGSAPNGSEVGFQFAVSNSSSGPWNFEGPSGDGTTYFYGTYVPGTPIPLVSNVGGSGYAMFNGFRYFRYQITLFSDSTHTYSPTITGVNVNWSP